MAAGALAELEADISRSRMSLSEAPRRSPALAHRPPWPCRPSRILPVSEPERVREEQDPYAQPCIVPHPAVGTHQSYQLITA